MIDTALQAHLKGVAGCYGREQASQHGRRTGCLSPDLTNLVIEVMATLIDTGRFDGDKDDARLMNCARVVLLQACKTASVAEVDAALAEWQEVNEGLCA